MKRNLKIIFLYSTNSFQLVFTNSIMFLFFILSKMIRITMFLVFLNFLFSGASSIANYSREQIIFFYLSFNVIDTAAQLLFREVYRFRPLVVSGNLDLILTKPVNPLIRVLLGGPDPIDTVVLVFVILVTVWFGVTQIYPSPTQWLIFLGLIINSVVISAAFHIAVLSLGVITTSVDHLVMIYRDLSSLLRIPVDIYIEPVRSLLTFVIPLGVMITFPAKALMGLLTLNLIIFSIALSFITLFLSYRLWLFSLTKYQSSGS